MSEGGGTHLLMSPNTTPPHILVLGSTKVALVMCYKKNAPTFELYILSVCLEDYTEVQIREFPPMSRHVRDTKGTHKVCVYR